MDAIKGLVLTLFWLIVLFGVAVGIGVKCAYDRVSGPAQETIRQVVAAVDSGPVAPPPEPFGAFAPTTPAHDSTTTHRNRTHRRH